MSIKMIQQSLGDKTYSLRESPKDLYQQLKRSFMAIIGAPMFVSMTFFMGIAMATPLKGTMLKMILPQFMNGVEKEFKKERDELLENVQGNVLDVGSGGGAYIKYCSKATKVVAIEPVQELHPVIHQEAEKVFSDNVDKKLTIVSSIEDIIINNDKESFDWIILGNVLCEVPCVPTTLDQVHSLLKPGGHVYFSEHVGLAPSSWKRTFQNIFNPYWVFVSGGCNCNRDSLVHIQNMQKQGKWDVIHWTYEYFTVIMGPFVLGLAQKKK